MTIEQKNGKISSMILARMHTGQPLIEAFDAVLGAGTFTRIAGEVWEAMQPSEPAQPEPVRFEVGVSYFCRSAWRSTVRNPAVVFACGMASRSSSRSAATRCRPLSLRIAGRWLWLRPPNRLPRWGHPACRLLRNGWHFWILHCQGGHP